MVKASKSFWRLISVPNSKPVRTVGVWRPRAEPFSNGESTDEIVRFCGESAALKPPMYFARFPTFQATPVIRWEHAPDFFCPNGDLPALDGDLF